MLVLHHRLAIAGVITAIAVPAAALASGSGSPSGKPAPPQGADVAALTPEFHVPGDLAIAATVGLICDETEGLTLLANFSLVQEAFENPGLAADREHRQAVLGSPTHSLRSRRSAANSPTPSQHQHARPDRDTFQARDTPAAAV